MTLAVAGEAGAAETAGARTAVKNGPKKPAQTRPGKNAAVPPVKQTDTEKVSVKTKENKTTAKKGSSRAAGFKRGYMPRIPPAKSVVRYRQVIAGEILVGSIVILLKPVDSSNDTDFAQSIEQLAAFLIAFFILSLMTSTGPSGARLSAALGGVIVLTLLLKNPNTIKTIIPPVYKGGASTDTSLAPPPNTGGGTATAVSKTPVTTSTGIVGQPGGVNNTTGGTLSA